MEWLVRGGTLVSAEAQYQADLRIRNGRIAEIGELLPLEGAQEIDAKGLLVLPGAIDAHTHLATQSGAAMSSDDYFTGTRAAACGGTTTVFDFLLQEPGEPLPETVRRRDALAAPDAAVDYAFHIGVSDVSTPELLDSMNDAVEQGFTSYKMYMVYAFGMDDPAFYRTLQRAGELGALIGVHAENRAVLEARVAQLLAEGKTEPWWHYISRCEQVAGEATERAIRLAEMANAPLYIAHLSDDRSMAAVMRARAEGLRVYAETCPQYLHFTNEVYHRERAQDFVCSPPMKGEASRAAIWDGIRRGAIDFIATDHCPFTQAEKDWGIRKPDGTPGNFTTIPNGCAGIEQMYPYMLSEANRGRLPITKVVKLCAENPAKLFGIGDRKGALRPGMDADFVLYDPHMEKTIHNAEMHGNTDHCIWEGVKLQGYPVATYSRGKLVYQTGRFVGERGYGRLLRCQRPQLL